jgi:hypothetical protein
MYVSTPRAISVQFEEVGGGEKRSVAVLLDFLMLWGWVGEVYGWEVEVFLLVEVEVI